jgi:type 2 lantibiotic biosynthesis protein LanM
MLEGFITALTPWVTTARARVREGLRALLARYPQPPVADPDALETMLYAGARRALEQMLAPTLALELNIARLQGELAGVTPEQRFAAYLERLSRPEVVYPLVAEYPVLFRLAVTRLEIWGNVSLELIERLCADWPLIAATFGAGRPPGRVTGLHGAQHTTKRGGRSVVIFSFASGLKVVYKPRSLAVDRHFQELLTWLNQAGHQPVFRTLTLLDRGAYGWVEWIKATACASETEVRRFYQRQGAYLALLYALEATDFHLSNVIAAGEHPMLIDLEALFHPRDAEPDWPPLELALDRLTYHSVLRPGLLPEPDLAEEETNPHFDLSGLAGAGGQVTPYTAPTWENRGTDAMRLVRKRVTLRGGKNLPTLCGQPVDLIEYRAAIDEGFTALYRLLTERRSELLAPGGPLAGFALDEVRVVPRSGRRYSTLLEQSFHPDLLRDAVQRDRFFDRLWEEVKREPHLARLIPYEQADLLAGDVPLFTTLADSRAAYSSAGEAIADFFPRSGLAAARQRIASLGESDLARQRWFIRASLATVPSAAQAISTYAYTLPASAPTGLQGQLIAQANAIARWLEEWAVQAATEASWVGVALVRDRHWVLEALGTDLYNGLPGVALFLAHLGVLTGEQRWTTLAQAAVATLRRHLAEESEAADAFVPIGAFDGLGGQLYTIAHLAVLWQDPALIHVAETLVETANLAEAEEPGLARGVAGYLAGLLAVYQVAPTPRTLQAARQAGDQLLNCIRVESKDVGQAASPQPTRPFASFLYGRAGAAWPLLALSAVSGESRYRTNAHVLLAETASPHDAAPGIWLAYLRALPWLDSAQQRATSKIVHLRVPTEVFRRLAARFKAALPGLLERGLGHNHSLGHGDLGYLDLSLQFSAAFNDAEVRHCCTRHAAAMVAYMQRHGWVTGVPLGVESPGLMAGLAGIGYGLLRLAEPERVPSALALEMPGRQDL